MTVDKDKNPNLIASQIMAVEVITNLLISTNPVDLSRNITDVIREITGAKTVFILSHDYSNKNDKILSVSPDRKLKQIEQFDLSIFCTIKNPESFPLFTADFSQDHPIKDFLSDMKAVNIIRFPIKAFNEIIGSIVIIDLHDPDRIEEVYDIFYMILPPIALALKNSLAHQQIEDQTKELKILMSNLEGLVNERTKALTDSNKELEIARLSALNLMQDAVDAQKQTAESNSKLQKEINTRLKAEEDLLMAKLSFESVINSVQEMIYILDKDSKFIYVNEAVVKKYGYDRSSILGQSPAFLSAPDRNDLEIVKEKLLMAYNGIPQTFEFWGLAKNGTVFPKEVSSSPGVYFGQKVIISVARDVSERKIAEIQIKSLLDEKDLLLKEVHHRIKNNMNTIISLLSLQSYNIKEQSAKDALEDAKNRVQSMMLLYDKLYKSKGFKEISIFEYLDPLLDEIVNSFPNRSKVTIIKKIDEFDVEAKILFSLGIMIYEIISNSMKHAFHHQDAGLINIEVTRLFKRIYIKIFDNGSGIIIQENHENQGFGMQLINLLALQLDADLDISNHEGTMYKLEFDYE